MNKKTTGIISGILTIAMCVSIVGCSKDENKSGKMKLGGNGSSYDTEYVKSIKKKYGGGETNTYTEPQYNVPRDTVFRIPVSKEVSRDGNIFEMFGVYLDSELTQKVTVNVSYDDDNEEVTIEPPFMPIAATSEDLQGIGFDENFNTDKINENVAYSDWGNANKYYLVTYVDVESGDKLDVPIVTIFTVKPEVDTPTVSLYTDEDGFVGIKWDKIDGADYYRVYKYSASDGTVDVNLQTEAETTDCMYDGFYQEAGYDGSYSSMNTDFATYIAATKYCVMAFNKEGKSLMSNVIDTRDYASRIPNSRNFDDPLFQASYFNSISSLPLTSTVKMCDGSVADFPVIYDIDSAKLDDPNAQSPVLKMNFKIQGTKFQWEVGIKNINKDTIDEELKALGEMQNSTAASGVTNSVDVSISSTPPKDLEDKNDESINNDKDTNSSFSLDDSKVFATSALSEYLAVNMLNGVETINLDEFNESSNTDYLIDCVYEAYYQNPLIMFLSGISYDYYTNDLILTYGQTREEQINMQNEVVETVEDVIPEIINDGMSDLEKEIAINNYLCDTAEYDTEALEEAKANNMESVDSRFNPTFTPYGVLVNKIGVCASYAGAFKLLAEAAGLESIVVTGEMSGGVSHAWNRINMDGQWYIVDSTNNDNENIPNGLLNLSDEVASRLLIEDSQYVLDNYYGNYTCDNSDKEYYKYTDKYFDKATISDKLAEGIKESSNVVLRTNYDLSNEEIEEILQQAMVKANVSRLENVYSLLGVISISK